MNALSTVERAPRLAGAALVRQRARSLRGHPLAILLSLAALYRLVGYAAAGPLLVPSDDSLRYAHGALVALFSDPFSPSGYPIALWALHQVWGSAFAVSLVQHILGLATVALTWSIGRRVSIRTGLPMTLAAVPAVYVAVSGDQWFYEQSLMTETLFTFLEVAAVWALLAAEEADRRALALTALAGACLAAAGTVRTVGLPIALVCIVWLAVLSGQPLRRRAALGLAGLVGFAAVIGLYTVAAAGGQSGIGSFSGWDLYGRVAPFADCTKFTPPKATRALCQSIPPAQRPGIYFYHFASGPTAAQTSPALLLFHVEPLGNAQLQQFAIAAIEGEPLTYLATVAEDAYRYIDPAAGARPEAGAGPEEVDIAAALAVTYPPRREVQALYGYHVSRGWMYSIFQSWLRVSRLPGLLWLLLVLAVPLGLIVSPARRTLILIAAVPLALALTPVLTVSYEYRFWLPGEGLMLLSGIVGCWLLVRRLRPRPASLAPSPGG